MSTLFNFTPGFIQLNWARVREKVNNTSLFVVYQESVVNNNIYVMRQTNIKNMASNMPTQKTQVSIQLLRAKQISKIYTLPNKCDDVLTSKVIGFKLPIPSHRLSSIQFSACIVNVTNDHHFKPPYNDHSIVVLEITTCERTLPLIVGEKTGYTQ